MSALTDAAFEHCQLIGAVPVDLSTNDARWTRAQGLVAAAAARARNHIRLTDAEILALSEDIRSSLAAVIGEMAAVRLQFNAAPSTDGNSQEGFYASSLLQPRFKRDLDDLFRPHSRAFTIVPSNEPSSCRPYDVTL